MTDASTAPDDTDRHDSELANKGQSTVKKISLLAITDLVPAPDNPRRHSRAQIRGLAKSIRKFRFNTPILVDKNRQIIAGHARFEAAKLLGLDQIPCIFLDHLSEDEAKAYRLADNQWVARSSWDDALVAAQLKELSALIPDFDLADIGFELPEVDVRIQSLDDPDVTDRADEFDAAAGPAVSVAGDLWLLGCHRLYCGNALESTAYAILMENKKAAAVITDPPYNQRIGQVTGRGRIKHAEFAMASGEMSEAEFTDFLTKSLELMRANTQPGGLIFAFMDWRHAWSMHCAGRAVNFPLLNIIIWSKLNAGLGSFYRSQHEMIFLFRNGNEPHLNNVELGKHGRSRSNIWTYGGSNAFPRRGAENTLSLHPTVKPIGLISDAILDCSNRHDIILDPYAGSGSAFLAAERTGRRCHGIEIAPIYCDTAIGRWERLTGRKAQNAEGKTFEQVKLERSAGQ